MSASSCSPAAGPVFSAGADLAALRALRDASYADNLADSERLGRLFEAILRHPKPVVARVHGHAIAGGCGLAAACDVSLVAESARLGSPRSASASCPPSSRRS